MGVKSENSEYSTMKEVWQRCNDVAAGTDAVHKGDEKYLPRLQDQGADNYAKSLKRTILFNATWRTIAGLSGMVFRKPPEIEVPAAITPMLEDVTMSGESLFMVAQDVTEECLKVGRVGILVDHPQGLTEGISLAQAESEGMRPFIKVYKANDIYNWRMGRVNNKSVLVEVRLRENHEVADGEWDVITEERYRVLSLGVDGYKVRVYKVDERGQEVLVSEAIPLMRGVPLTYIPFQFIGTDDVSADVDAPPLIDLVDMNLHHYRITSIKCNALPFAVPTMFIAGRLNLEAGEKIYVGSATAIHSDDPQAKCTYAEFTGQGLQPVEKEIDKAEAQMAILGARMLEPQRGSVESAEGQSIHRKGEESILSAISQTISIGLTNVMTWFADWAGASGTVKISLNRDFYPVGMTPQMLTALLASWQQGMPGFSSQNVYSLLQNREIADKDVTFEEEEARIGNAPPMLAAPATAPLQTEQVQTEPAEAVDMQPLIDSITALMAKLSEPQEPPVINIPATVVNIPEQPAPVINIAPAAINIAPPAITVNMPEQQPANVTVNNVEGTKTIGIQRDAEGNIIGGTVQ